MATLQPEPTQHSKPTFVWVYIAGTCGYKVIDHKMCVCRGPLQILSESFLILIRTERDIIKNVYWSSLKVPLLFLSEVNKT